MLSLNPVICAIVGYVAEGSFAIAFRMAIWSVFRFISSVDDEISDEISDSFSSGRKILDRSGFTRSLRTGLP